jgi:hypothetical protein
MKKNCNKEETSCLKIKDGNDGKVGVDKCSLLIFIVSVCILLHYIFMVFN